MDDENIFKFNFLCVNKKSRSRILNLAFINNILDTKINIKLKKFSYTTFAKFT